MVLTFFCFVFGLVLANFFPVHVYVFHALDELEVVVGNRFLLLG